MMEMRLDRCHLMRKMMQQSSSTERLTHWCLGIVGLIPADESIYTLPIAGGGAKTSQ